VCTPSEFLKVLGHENEGLEYLLPTTQLFLVFLHARPYIYIYNTYYIYIPETPFFLLQFFWYARGAAVLFCKKNVDPAEMKAISIT
jgi:hypothetical protein